MRSNFGKTKRIVSLLLTLMMLLGITAMAVTPAAAEEDRVNEARNSVAALMVYFEESGTYTFERTEAEWFSLGTCFFVGNDPDSVEYLITNYHVVDLYYEGGSGELIKYNGVMGRMKIRVYFDTVSSDDYIEAYPVEVNEKYDVAVLRLEHSTNKRQYLPIDSPTDSIVGKTVYVLGFPGLTDSYNVDATSHFKPTDVSITSGIVSRLYTQQGTGWKNINIDANIKHGNSGGPLITKEGVAIGINTWSAINSSGEEDFMSVNMEHAITLLDRNGIKFIRNYNKSEPDPEPTDSPAQTPTQSNTPESTTVQPTASDATVGPNSNTDKDTAKDSDKDSGSDNMMMIIIIIAAAVVVIAVIIIIILVAKKGKKNNQPPAGPGAAAPVMPAAPYAPMPSQGPRPPQINNRPPMPPQNSYVPSNEGAGETSVLSEGAGETTVLNGQGGGLALVRRSNGERIVISKQEFIIGKERRRVDYCISDNNSISRAHAKLRVRSGRCYVSDLGSTNCTFVNGTKLSPNQEVILSKGDIVKLSDEEFIFEG